MATSAPQKKYSGNGKYAVSWPAAYAANKTKKAVIPQNTFNNSFTVVTPLSY